jgi:hypothetical protein
MKAGYEVFPAHCPRTASQTMNGVIEISESRLRLLRSGLLAKGIAETVFVSVLALGFYLTTFPPWFRGKVDVADATQVSGWAVNSSTPAAVVEVQLYIDGHFIADALAGHPRADIQAAGIAPDANHGFVFAVPPELGAGEHEARVYIAHVSNKGERRTLQMLDIPKKFAR